MAKTELQVVLTARDQASKTVRNFNTSLGSMAKQATAIVGGFFAIQKAIGFLGRVVNLIL